MWYEKRGDRRTLWNRLEHLIPLFTIPVRTFSLTSSSQIYLIYLLVCTNLRIFETITWVTALSSIFTYYLQTCLRRLSTSSSRHCGLSPSSSWRSKKCFRRVLLFLPSNYYFSFIWHLGKLFCKMRTLPLIFHGERINEREQGDVWKFKTLNNAKSKQNLVVHPVELIVRKIQRT